MLIDTMSSKNYYNSIRDLEPYDMSKCHNHVIAWDLYISRYGFESHYTNIITRYDVSLAMKDITVLPGFKYSGKTFYVHSNSLTSLEGSPIYVGGDFHCELNNLTNLKGCPTYVGSDFWCINNKTIISPPKNLLVMGKFIND
jgi:hypothetical protein